MKIGFIGLGNMGSALVKNALNHNIEVVGYNRSSEKTNSIKQQNFTPTFSLQELVENLPQPKIIWLMLSVGEPINNTIKELTPLLSSGDIIIDGANSHYQDSKARANKLAETGIHFLDCGTSGGVEGALNGASIMVGGNKQAFEVVEPLFKAISAENGYGYFGESGAGHFVKMVHNGIEYGMMQAIAEGSAILEASEYKPDLAKATQVWSNGSIIQSNLIKWLHQITTKDHNLSNTDSTIGSLGTGKWTVQAALDLGIPAHVISAAVFARYESRPESKFGKKVVQALREHFGMHNINERDAR